MHDNCYSTSMWKSEWWCQWCWYYILYLFLQKQLSPNYLRISVYSALHYFLSILTTSLVNTLASPPMCIFMMLYFWHTVINTHTSVCTGLTNTDICIFTQTACIISCKQRQPSVRSNVSILDASKTLDRTNLALVYQNTPLLVFHVFRLFTTRSGGSKGGLGGPLSPSDFWLALCLPPSFVFNFTLKFVWLTYTEGLKTIWRLSGDGSDDIHKPLLGLVGLIIANQCSLQRKITMQERHLFWTPTFFLGPAVPPQFFHSKIATDHVSRL